MCIYLATGATGLRADCLYTLGLRVGDPGPRVCRQEPRTPVWPQSGWRICSLRILGQSLREDLGSFYLLLLFTLRASVLAPFSPDIGKKLKTLGIIACRPQKPDVRLESPTVWRRITNITGSYIFEGFLSFPGSDLDENWRKSSWNLPGPSYTAPKPRF